MCKPVSPGAFLAIAFNKTKKDNLPYSELEKYRKSLQRIHASDKDTYDVSWDHDSYNFTMRFYSPVFKASPSGVACNLKELKHYFKTLVADIPKDDLVAVMRMDNA